MSKTKLIQINLSVAKELVRLLKRVEDQLCIGCSDESHDESYPATEAIQLRNYLTPRISNPHKNDGI